VTTIAYRDGVLASDSRLTLGEVICTDKCKKIWRLADGGLFGASGNNESGLIVLKALQKDTPLPKLDGEMYAIHIRPNGRIYVSEGRLWDHWPEAFIACGSGQQAALAAMRSGADAVTAVKAGIALDVYSGGRVQKLELKRKRK
jgi:ATP-dependent protease HslVU (ClpYQ) peptidase subunit